MMNIRNLLNKKVDRLNDIFEHEHLPYVADPIYEKNAAEIIDIDNNTETGIYIYMPVPINGECTLCTPGWHDIVDANDLKLVRDICGCLLELNNNVITKSETKSTNQGTNYSDVIKAIMNNSTLMQSTRNQLIDMIPIYFDSVIYESIIAVVSNQSVMCSTIVRQVKSICAQACKAGDRRD